MSVAETSIRLLKNIARPPYHAMQAFVRRVEGLGELRAVESDLKRRAPALIKAISEYDEMVLYGINTGQDRRAAIAEYLRIGEVLMGNFQDALMRNGKRLETVRSVLDFACGYGRVTRWIVAKRGAANVWASDIDPRAVEFVRNTFGVNGFTSTENASDLKHGASFEAIYVVSLFSHLTIEHWRRWAAQLIAMLERDGVLVFSTHGMQLYEDKRSDIKALFYKVADGFVYNRTNETMGRLAGEYYGTAYVEATFVRNTIAACGGEVVDYVGKGVAGYHDLYVARKV